MKPIELGTSQSAQEAFDVSVRNAQKTVRDLQVKYTGKGSGETKDRLDDVQYYLQNDGNLPTGSQVTALNDAVKNVSRDLPLSERASLNKLIGDLNTKVGPLRASKTKYGNETNYTLQGGKDYRETIFTLPEDIPTNASLRNKGGHFTDVIGDTNNIYLSLIHISEPTRPY